MADVAADAESLVGREESKAIVKLAVELGCNLIDTCDVSFSNMGGVAVSNAHLSLYSSLAVLWTTYGEYHLHGIHNKSIVSDNSCNRARMSVSLAKSSRKNLPKIPHTGRSCFSVPSSALTGTLPTLAPETTSESFNAPILPTSASNAKLASRILVSTTSTFTIRIGWSRTQTRPSKIHGRPWSSSRKKARSSILV